MQVSCRLAVLLASLLGFALASPAPAAVQGQDWSERFHVPGIDVPQLSTGVFDLAVFDDGCGPALYATGRFHSADGRLLEGIARYDGIGWTAVGGGLESTGVGFCLAVYDDGSGPALFLGGVFQEVGGVPASNLARWDGATWSAVEGPFGEGTDAGVNDLMVYDDGTGEELYVGGGFVTAGGVPAGRVARWGPGGWSAVGGGFDDAVAVFHAYDDGQGVRLLAGGDFGLAEGQPAGGLAAWDGGSWTEFAGGVDGSVWSLTTWDDGSGPVLAAGGRFRSAGFAVVPVNSLAVWDGGAWSALGPVVSGYGKSVTHVTSFDEGIGLGPILVLSRDVNALSTRLERWDGVAFSPLAGDIVGYKVHALLVADLGHGEELFIGGGFETLGAAPPGFASQDVVAWDGSAARAIGHDAGAPEAPVEALAVHDDGAGESLFVGGQFLQVGGFQANHVARFDGVVWSALGSGVDATVRALAAFDEGTGPVMFAGGDFAKAGGAPAGHVARWDGAAWTEVGGGVSGDVYALGAFDLGGGPVLVAGGDFTAAGGAPAAHVAQWDGVGWASLGSGLPGRVRAVEMFNGELYAGGDFVGAQTFIARWDGAQWNGLPQILNGAVHALKCFDDGTGAALVATGDFTVAGSVQSANNIARWRGSDWQALASGLGAPGRSLEVFDDGFGSTLYAGGGIFKNGSFGIVRWNQTTQSWNGQGVFGTGLRGTPLALKGWGDELFAGGTFQSANARSSKHIASWGAALDGPAEVYCTPGTTANGCQASMSGGGNASLSLNKGFDVTARGVEGNKPGILFWGLGEKASPWGTGTSLVCVAGATVRTPVQNSGGADGTCDGQLHIDFNAWMAAHAPKAPAAGTAVRMQAWFRDPPSPKGTSLSDALRFNVLP